MKKISLKDSLKRLSREEMRNISGGIVSPGGGGFSNTINLSVPYCVDECFIDEDCSCKSCFSYPGAPKMRCDYIHCSGTGSQVKKVCRC